MATVAKSVPDQANPAAASSQQWPWTTIAWVGALLIISYAPVLRWLVYQWYTDEDMGHGFIVPIVAGYIIWQRRDVVAKIRPQTSYWGLVLVLWSAIQFIIGTLGANVFAARTAFLLS